ncbi:glycosyltransferase family 10 domain-containing protein [Celeribacter sp.]|uniref:glycosyltransferase family 10 domain-containing protein n=1 Tax=Celeribacter sp. TaxID=1890673 RepID=UPI003A9072AE
MKTTLRIHCCDFWPDFVPENDVIFALLNEEFDLVMDADNPEILLYSCNGLTHMNYDCVKIFITEENITPDFNLCDYAVGFDHMTFEDRYLRFPTELAKLADLDRSLHRPKTVEEVRERKFCNFIYSNGGADPVRDRFFHILHAMEPVASLGRHLHNTDSDITKRFSSDWSSGKAVIQSRYNFTIAFENSSKPGYVTEKIAHAYVAGTVPIYWGDTTVSRYINPKSFINAHDFASLEDCARYVVELNAQPERILDYLNEPVFVGGRVPDELDVARLREFLCDICTRSPEERVRRTTYGNTKLYLKLRKRMSAIETRRQARNRRIRSTREFLLGRRARK